MNINRKIKIGILTIALGSSCISAFAQDVAAADTIGAEEAVSKIRSLKERQIDILSGEVDGTYLNTSVAFM